MTSGVPRLELSVGGPFARTAPAVERYAARAVVTGPADELLLLRSRHGDLKFPGGGVEAGESPEQALLRELTEECGVVAAEVGALVLTAREVRAAIEPGHVFVMTSSYFLCRLAGPVGEVATGLEQYEQDLGLTPVWLPVTEALAVNRRVASGSAAVEVPWLRRETAVLAWMQRQDWLSRGRTRAAANDRHRSSGGASVRARERGAPAT